jgi:murein DD-endopeptidase MepM/ murein hydrolase activator NlpD
MVHPPADQLDRIRRERELVNGLWRSGEEAVFSLPFTPPLDPMPELRNFGSRRVFNGEPRSPHSGADLSAPVGTPVFAAAAGTVVLTGSHYYSGGSVFIDHGDDLVTMYFHLDRVDVGNGERVVRGQRIGAVGATGRVTGPHLHFGVRWHGARIDPAVLLADPEKTPNVDEEPL